MITTICDGNTCEECKSKYGRHRCDGFPDYKGKVMGNQ